MRARLAIAAAGLQVQLREIVLRNKPSHMLEISPKGTVPVLQLSDGTVLQESLDIMFWALQQSDPNGLLPTDQEQLSLLHDLLAINDGVFKQGLDRYKYPPRYTDEHAGHSPEQFGALHRDAAAKHLYALNQRLAQQSYLLGPQLTMADLAIAPFVRQYAHTDLDWFQAQDWSHLITWLQRFLDLDRFMMIMKKQPPWADGDEPLLFPFQP